MSKPQVEFSFREMTQLAAFIAALQLQGVGFRLQKDEVAIAVIIC